jgi:predicted MFS family arabinose efflux permease
VTHVDVSALSLILLGLGLAGMVGTYLIGLLLPARLHGLLIGAPLALALIAVALIVVGASPVMAAILLAAWGLVGTAAPVAWWTWLSKALPDDAEAGGGLMVAVVQLAITFGASLGGLLVDSRGYHPAFAVSAAILCGASLLALLGSRRSPTKVQP